MGLQDHMVLRVERKQAKQEMHDFHEERQKTEQNRKLGWEPLMAKGVAETAGFCGRGRDQRNTPDKTAGLMKDRSLNTEPPTDKSETVRPMKSGVCIARLPAGMAERP